jgi:arylformamidase
LSHETAFASSPLYKVPLVPARIVIAWGEVETEAFKQQSRVFAERLKNAGLEVISIEVPGRNHFDLPFALADEASNLGTLFRESTHVQQ